MAVLVIDAASSLLMYWPFVKSTPKREFLFRENLS